MTQNIAHFFNLSNSLFQVVRRKRLAPELLVEGPILLICVSLLRGLQYDNMDHLIVSHFNLVTYFYSVDARPMHGHYVTCMFHRGHLDIITYFHFHSEGRHLGVLSTTHDHLLKRVPFIVAAHGAFLLHGLNNMFLFDCALRLRSCCTRSALEGPLRPSSHRPANLRRAIKKKLLIFCSTEISLPWE